MRKILLILFVFIFSSTLFAQTPENEVFVVLSRVKIHLPSQDMASLYSGQSSRYIQVGVEGYSKDQDYVQGAFDRYTVRDQDMIISVEHVSDEGTIRYVKFYLAPAFDANDFQQMLEFLGVRHYIFAGEQKKMSDFSGQVYAWLKSVSR